MPVPPVPACTADQHLYRLYRLTLAAPSYRLRNEARSPARTLARAVRQVGPYLEYVTMGSVVAKRGALGQWGSRLYVSSAPAEAICKEVSK